ncbi:MAG: restriction endonuclease, partial [Betaproteobacteria bacterium]|nr:restriction endonuclease [Betaproteobacteria bacterium]
WKETGLNRWHKDKDKGKAEMLPLYEGKMVQMYDHRAADVVRNPHNLHRPAQQEALPDELKIQPDRFPVPQYWVNREDAGEISDFPYAIAYKSVTAPTNVRTMIAGLLPTCGTGNSMGMLVFNAFEAPHARSSSLLMANISAFAYDFVLRQKIQGQNLNWFILEQLPVIAPERFEESIGDVNIGDYVCEEALALTYTAHDMAPFARDLGYVDGKGNVKPPFVWDKTDRIHRMARLDALFMYLYGLSQDDADYILSTFPIVKQQDKAAFGSFLTRDLILAYLRRIESGLLDHESLPIVVHAPLIPQA